jgi:hypothetical protein
LFGVNKVVFRGARKAESSSQQLENKPVMRMRKNCTKKLEREIFENKVLTRKEIPSAHYGNAQMRNPA